MITPFEDPAEGAISEVWKVLYPDTLVGLCDDPRELLADDVELAEGCESYLEYEDGEFIGGTEGRECLNDFGGAVYATSEITITEERMTSWDRGYDGADVQIWGAVSGPYIFDRKTPRLSFDEITR